ncbi:hypothetical protein AVEN_170104-1 [Araneus ventricosus]|uniref:Thyroglobulin type-1 domain-containing protein n=1 Tax=Araneus ventricosus TaxID=182803 RepID=A0A4Y2IF42_ARAVE|nr:hypothetical protein AVEN_170104-1 [Araneus ventricosus]
MTDGLSKFAYCSNKKTISPFLDPLYILCNVLLHDSRNHYHVSSIKYMIFFLTDKDEGLPECYNNGYFKPLQCNEKTKECWCVTKYGNQVAPPSPDRKSCDDVTHLL